MLNIESDFIFAEAHLFLKLKTNLIQNSREIEVLNGNKISYMELIEMFVERLHKLTFTNLLKTSLRELWN